MFIRGAQSNQHGTLIYDLKSQYTRKVNHYPEVLNADLHIPNTHEKIKRSKEIKDKEKTKEKNEGL